MQKVSLRKLSLLGLVLMGASAVTAAVLPKVTADKDYTPGSLTASTFAGNPGGLTCTVDTAAAPGITAPCNITTNSYTTGANPNSTDPNQGLSTAGVEGVDVDNR